MQSFVRAAGDPADLFIASGILSEIGRNAGDEPVYVTGYGPYGVTAVFAASAVSGESFKGGLRTAVFNSPGLPGSLVSLLSWKSLGAAAAAAENVHSSLDCYQDTGLQIGHRLVLGHCLAGQRSPQEMYTGLQRLLSGGRNAAEALSAAESLLRESLGGKAGEMAGGASLLRGSHARRDIITRLADEPVLSGGFHIGVKLCEQSVVSRCSHGRYPEVFPLKRDNRDSEGAAADPDFR